MLVLKVVVGVMAFLVVGNLAILAASLWARETTPMTPVDSVAGVDNLQVVDAQVWRGGAPTAEGYRSLAAAGTSTVVDLRTDGTEHDEPLVGDLGMRLVRIPIRDGQVPSADEVGRFVAAVQDSPGLVFVHCGAGVGRTGAMVGAYRVGTGELNGRGALRQNLAVGPPSLEQVAFVARLKDGRVARPGAVLTAASRVLDAPRRLWARLGT